MRLKILTIIFILTWCGIFLSQKINLSTADLGRHITNGKVLVEAPFAEKLALLKTNFYSYSMSEAPFLNHHWASGIISYFIHEIFGFTGLSIFYVLASLVSVLLFWNIARHLSNFYIASFFTIVFTPILASRAEVRPEALSLLFSGIFLNILYFKKYIWALPILMMLWVNLHIGFIFGFLVLGSFFITDIKRFWKLGVATLLAALINPFGYKMILYPFRIFENYGYKIVENQSIHFLENLGFTEGQHFLLFKVIAILVIISMFFTRRPLAILLPTVACGILAYFGIRHFPIFGLFALVWVSCAFYQVVMPKFSKDIFLAGSAVLIVLSVSLNLGDIKNFGWGLSSQVLEARDFMKAKSISGPIFNNYDVGGYLIYSLYPQQKVFVDNRPEAYTKEFFEMIYIPAQQDESKWQELDSQHDFQTIIFSHRDYTPWGQEFLASRLEDKKWEKVFQDNYIIIFSKRQETFGP